MGSRKEDEEALKDSYLMACFLFEVKGNLQTTKGDVPGRKKLLWQAGEEANGERRSYRLTKSS